MQEQECLRKHWHCQKLTLVWATETRENQNPAQPSGGSGVWGVPDRWPSCSQFFQAARVICVPRQLVWSESLLSSTACLRVTSSSLYCSHKLGAGGSWRIWPVSDFQKQLFYFYFLNSLSLGSFPGGWRRISSQRELLPKSALYYQSKV